MTRYIGARYVPLLMGTWDNTQTYEQLCVVQYQGNSYTSKIPVPAGVEITNTNYWIKTGDYNAQWAAFEDSFSEYQAAVQEEINSFASDILEVKTLELTGPTTGSITDDEYDALTFTASDDDASALYNTVFNKYIHCTSELSGIRHGTETIASGFDDVIKVTYSPALPGVRQASLIVTVHNRSGYEVDYTGGKIVFKYLDATE